MKGILKELGKEIRKDISRRKPKNKVTDHPFLSVRVPCTIINKQPFYFSAINYVATPPKGMDTET